MTFKDNGVKTSCPAFVRFPVGEVVDNRPASGAYWDGNMGWERLERNHSSYAVGRLPAATATPIVKPPAVIPVPAPYNNDKEWRLYRPQGIPPTPAAPGVPPQAGVIQTQELLPFPLGGNPTNQPPTMGINIFVIINNYAILRLLFLHSVTAEQHNLSVINNIIHIHCRRISTHTSTFSRWSSASLPEHNNASKPIWSRGKPTSQPLQDDMGNLLCTRTTC
jgi:hypothetical protein